MKIFIFIVEISYFKFMDKEDKTMFIYVYLPLSF